MDRKEQKLPLRRSTKIPGEYCSDPAIVEVPLGSQLSPQSPCNEGYQLTRSVTNL
jgi:hypothetical protein